MSRKRLNPNEVAEWIALGSNAERLMAESHNATKAATMAEIADENGITEQHVRRLIAGVRFIRDVSATDRELAHALERSSYNLTEIIARWHTHDAVEASRAAIRYHRAEISLADVKHGYEGSRLQPVPAKTSDRVDVYLNAVRRKIARLDRWTGSTETAPRRIEPFGAFDLSFRQGKNQELGVLAPRPNESEKDRASRFVHDAALILAASQVGITTIVAIQSDRDPGRYGRWINDLKIDTCSVVEMTRVIQEDWK